MLTKKTSKLNEQKTQKKLMLTKNLRKNRIYCILVTTRFFTFFCKKVFWKNENWTIL